MALGFQYDRMTIDQALVLMLADAHVMRAWKLVSAVAPEVLRR
jgi:peroxiredoxin